MTSEQLQHARAERWRQSSNPILTAEDAQAWMDGIGFCLFLPRRAHFLASAPSFAEAVIGAPTDAPARESVENALTLLHRLTGSAGGDAAVVPMNLFGVAASFGNGAMGASDQPDFLVTRATLPYVFSLIGGRNWKSGPGAKASPLVLEIWKQLEEAGAQTAGEIQAALGRELTEAAVLRGLMELWHGLRAIPVYDDAARGEATRWELTQARFAAEMTASQKVAQTTALSALVSLYLESTVAASSEEIETFLSPLASRSRVREVVNGLSATRQLGLISVGAQPLLHVAGSLPEFEEAEPAKKETRPTREPRVPSEKRDGGFPRERGARPYGGGGPRERGRGGPRPEREGRERTGFGRPEAGQFAARGEGSGSKPERLYRKPEDRRPVDRERKSFGKKPFERSARPADSRPLDREKARDGGGGNFPPKRFGKSGARSWKERGGDERPFRPRHEEERGGERRSGGFGGAGKPGGKRSGGPKKFSGSKFGGKKFGESKFGSRGGGGKRPFFHERPTREDESRGSGFKRHAGEGERDARRPGEWKSRPAGSGFQKSGGRGFGKFSRPGFKSGGKPGFENGGKPGFKREGGEHFKKTGFGKTTKPFGKSGKPFGRSAGSARNAGKPFGKPNRPFEKSPRPSGRVEKRGSGGPERGGFKPPFRRRKKDGDGGGE